MMSLRTLFTLSILFVLLTASFAAGCSDDKDPCQKACSKYKKCVAPADKGVPDGGGASTGDAGVGVAAWPFYLGAGPGAGACSLSEACSPKEQCLAACVNAASCAALTGKDPTGVKSVNDCLQVCSSKKWDGGVKKDTGVKKDVGGKQDKGPCQPNCSDRVCGSDGCGGQCGPQCPNNLNCNSAGQCVPGCQPQCTDRVCGPDGCGGQCGPQCPNNLNCNNQGKCVPNCQPNCSGKVCGPDGCGGQCGPQCPNNHTCDSAGQCVPNCQPNCAGKVCGSNGCGGQCGTCKSYETCSTSGQCTQTGCGPITSTGCCDKELLKYCDSGTFKTIDCTQNPSCGWSSQGGFFDCATTGAGHPSGTYPKACP